MCDRCSFEIIAQDTNIACYYCVIVETGVHVCLSHQKIIGRNYSNIPQNYDFNDKSL